jgi:hypothetical protein
MTAAERVRRYRLKHGTDKRVTEPETKPASGDGDAALKARCAALEKELAAAKARITEMLLDAAARRFAPRPKAAPRPKVEKPPLPPDEVRDRRIKALTTANQELRAKLRHLRQHYDEAMAQVGAMSFTTRSAIHRALQPDSSEEVKGEARRAFNGFVDDQKRSRGRA